MRSASLLVTAMDRVNFVGWARATIFLLDPKPIPWWAVPTLRAADLQ